MLTFHKINVCSFVSEFDILLPSLNFICLCLLHKFSRLSDIMWVVVWSEKTKCGVSKNNYDRRLPNGRYSKTHEKLKKILVSSASNRGPKFQKYDFFEKNACLALICICSYLTVVACTVGKNSLNGRKWHITGQSILIFDESYYLLNIVHVSRHVAKTKTVKN